jgi:hypothetical protein
VSRIVWSDRVREWQLVEALWERELYLNLVDRPEHENAAYLPAVAIRITPA